MVDRDITNARYSCFIGTDDEAIGREVAEYIGNKFRSKLLVLQLMGPRNSITSQSRYAGFVREIAKYPQITCDHIVHGDWDKEVAIRVSDSILSSGYVPDVVFAHNDMMAGQFAIIAQQHGISPFIIGVDGMAQQNGGVDMVLNRQIDATFANPTGGKEAITKAMAILNGDTVERTEWLESFLIDLTNAPLLKKQFIVLNDQNEKIKKQRAFIERQSVQISDQRYVVVLALVVVLLLVFFLVWILLSLLTKVRLLRTIQMQKVQIESQMAYQEQLLIELKDKTLLLKDQKDEIETQRDAIFAQNQELEAYGNEMEIIVAKRTEELRLALDRAQESDRLKTAFLSNLSHEIRTPLNAIVGFTELFCEPDAEFEERIGFQKVIRKNTQELLSLVDHVIELSMLTTGQVKLTLKVCGIEQVFDNLYSQILKNIEEGFWSRFENVELRLAKGDNVRLSVDCSRLGEIVLHLVQNALKHTHHGFVEMGWELIGDGRALRIYVSDTGVGIPSDYKEVIFDMFRKVETHSMILYRGAGMGLTIVKHLAELMGVKVNVDSEVGRGSTFWFDVGLPTDSEFHA